MRYARTLLFLIAAVAAPAQDYLRVTSPNGQIDARFGVVLPPEPGAFMRLAYMVNFRGKPLLDLSYMGILLHNQEPLLGETLGLSESSAAKGPGYNAATGQFLQNGSLGRRINVEMRVFDEGLAFRYILPRTAMLEDLYLEKEETEFRLPQEGNVQLADGRRMALSKLSGPVQLPLMVEQPGTGWLSFSEARVGSYAQTWIEPRGGRVLATHLDAPPGKELPVEGVTPLTTSWRVILVGPGPQATGIAAKYLN